MLRVVFRQQSEEQPGRQCPELRVTQAEALAADAPDVLPRGRVAGAKGASAASSSSSSVAGNAR
jgi:hypothetical protein